MKLWLHSPVFFFRRNTFFCFDLLYNLFYLIFKSGTLVELLQLFLFEALVTSYETETLCAMFNELVLKTKENFMWCNIYLKHFPTTKYFVLNATFSVLRWTFPVVSGLINYQGQLTSRAPTHLQLRENEFYRLPTILDIVDSDTLNNRITKMYLL